MFNYSQQFNNNAYMMEAMAPSPSFIHFYVPPPPIPPVLNQLIISPPPLPPPMPAISKVCNQLADNNSLEKEINLKDKSDYESDGEHPELGPNWRCRRLFNGKVRGEDLPLNCSRPQTDKGRSFSALKSTFYECHDTEHTSSFKLKKERKNGYLSSTSNNGYISSNGTTWVRKIPREANIIEADKSSSSDNIATTSNVKSNTTIIKKHKFVNSLRIIDGKRIYNRTNTASKDCFQYAGNANCLSGIFCPFEHNGSTTHQNIKTCHKLLRGICREKKDCSIDQHLLFEHQYSVCQDFLNFCCIVEDCPYLHVKYSEGLDPCEDFNNGKCRLGIMCQKPHRYYYSTIKSRSNFKKAYTTDNLENKNKTYDESPFSEEEKNDSDLLEEDNFLHNGGLKWLE